jgi:hypothetical protein
MSMAAGPHRVWLVDMNRQRRLIMDGCCLVYAVPQLAAALVLCLLATVPPTLSKSPPYRVRPAPWS